MGGGGGLPQSMVNSSPLPQLTGYVPLGSESLSGNLRFLVCKTGLTVIPVPQYHSEMPMKDIKGLTQDSAEGTTKGNKSAGTFNSLVVPSVIFKNSDIIYTPESLPLEDDSAVFSISTKLYNHYHCLFQDIFIIPKRNPTFLGHHPFTTLPFP